MSDLHIVRYTTKSGDSYVQTEPLEWDKAITEWDRLDDLRVTGFLPWVQYFEVRSVDDPTNPSLFAPTRKWRGTPKDHHSNLRHRFEIAENQSVYTFQCLECGKVYQGSGLGFGSHRRACPARTGAQVFA